MATWNGAEALGWQDRIGRLSIGMDADFIAVDLETPHSAPVIDAATALVYSAKSSDVRHVVVAGEVLVRDGALARWDAGEIVRLAGVEAKRVAARVMERST
jgi:5-methylthioadenosine/S-adenosylhomocysteine deaminase